MCMAEWETIQERTVSGKGVLKVPTDTVKNRAYVLYVDVIRKPKQSYLNLNYNPSKSRYGNLVFLRNGYVLNTISLEYERQVFDGVNDISGQTLLAVKCAYEGILQTFYNLSIALAATPGGVGLTPLTITDLIKDYESLRFAWDEIRVMCYADTGLSLRLTRLKYDTCDPDKDKDKPPPPPPPPPPPTPPGDPLPNSDPYDEDTGDDGNSAPYPGDEPDTPPPPSSYQVRVIGSWYGGGCAVIPAGSVYADLGVQTTDNIEIEVTGTGPSCGGYFFVVRNMDNGSTLLVGSSEAISVGLEITPIP